MHSSAVFELKSTSSKVDIVLEGGLPVLIDMMHSADVETSHQSTGVVANLAEAVENQSKMVEAGETGRAALPKTLEKYIVPVIRGIPPPRAPPGSVLRLSPLVIISYAR